MGFVRWILEIPARRRARRAQRQLAEDFRVIDEQRAKLLRTIFPPTPKSDRPCSHTYDHEGNGADLPIPAPSGWRKQPEEPRDE